MLSPRRLPIQCAWSPPARLSCPLSHGAPLMCDAITIPENGRRVMRRKPRASPAERHITHPMKRAQAHGVYAADWAAVRAVAKPCRTVAWWPRPFVSASPGEHILDVRGRQAAGAGTTRRACQRPWDVRLCRSISGVARLEVDASHRRGRSSRHQGVRCPRSTRSSGSSHTSAVCRPPSTRSSRGASS
jgi:hypothetical protein